MPVCSVTDSTGIDWPAEALPATTIDRLAAEMALVYRLFEGPPLRSSPVRGSDGRDGDERSRRRPGCQRARPFVCWIIDHRGVMPPPSASQCVSVGGAAPGQRLGASVLCPHSPDGMGYTHRIAAPTFHVKRRRACGSRRRPLSRSRAIPCFSGLPRSANESVRSADG